MGLHRHRNRFPWVPEKVFLFRTTLATVK